MKILVCIKQVPDTVEVKIDPKTGIKCRPENQGIMGQSENRNNMNRT